MEPPDKEKKRRKQTKDGQSHQNLKQDAQISELAGDSKGTPTTMNPDFVSK